MKKKIFGFLFVFFIALTLVACGDKTGGGNGGGGGNTPGGNTPAPEEIVIMHGAVHEIDPRHPNYSGREQGAKLKKLEEVEKDLNVKVTFKAYPPSAPWSDKRAEYIINQHITGQAEADIYWVTTQWLGMLVEANAIVPISRSWQREYGKNVDKSYLDASTMRGQEWGFGPDALSGDQGLFYNDALRKTWDLEDPVELWNKGEWTWSKFEQFADAAKNKAVAEGTAVLGSHPSLYAANLIPLNGGSIASLKDQRIGMADTEASETYTYLERLYSKGLFETDPNYDKGSTAWGNGQVLFHPGSLWFVKADNRWGDYDFVKQGHIGVVPYPMPDGSDKSKYVKPLGGEAIYTIASNPKNKAKEELSYRVWNEIQLWATDEEGEDTFRDVLDGIFSDPKWVDVYMETSKNVYFDIHEDIGISSYQPDAWQSRVNAGIRNGDTISRLSEILPTYQKAMEDYFAS